MLSVFPRLDFERLVRQTGAEFATKGFSIWGHYVAMLFGQLGQAHSLREICNGWASCFGKLKHLGISQSPKRSTLAYAHITEGKVHEVNVFKKLRFSPGTIVVFDRGLVDYQPSAHGAGVSFPDAPPLRPPRLSLRQGEASCLL